MPSYIFLKFSLFILHPTLIPSALKWGNLHCDLTLLEWNKIIPRLTQCQRIEEVSRASIYSQRASCRGAHDPALQSTFGGPPPCCFSVQLRPQKSWEGPVLYVPRAQPFPSDALLSLLGIAGVWETESRVQMIVDHRTRDHLCVYQPCCFF